MRLRMSRISAMTAVGSRPFTGAGGRFPQVMGGGQGDFPIATAILTMAQSNASSGLHGFDSLLSAGHPSAEIRL